jgi:hypothetical protein
LEPYERHTVRNFLASRPLLDKSYASLTSIDDLEARLDCVRSIENTYHQHFYTLVRDATSTQTFKLFNDMQIMALLKQSLFRLRQTAEIARNFNPNDNDHLYILRSRLAGLNNLPSLAKRCR